MNSTQIQYISNENGKPTAVIVPIDLWQQILAEQGDCVFTKKRNYETTVIIRERAQRRHRVWGGL